MFYASFNNKAWTRLLYGMVSTGLKENDWCFFTSKFYRDFIADYLDEKTRANIDNFVVEFERKHKETLEQAIESLQSLTDNGFIKLFNLFGANNR